MLGDARSLFVLLLHGVEEVVPGRLAMIVNRVANVVAMRPNRSPGDRPRGHVQPELWNCSGKRSRSLLSFEYCCVRLMKNHFGGSYLSPSDGFCTNLVNGMVGGVFERLDCRPFLWMGGTSRPGLIHNSLCVYVNYSRLDYRARGQLIA